MKLENLIKKNVQKVNLKFEKATYFAKDRYEKSKNLLHEKNYLCLNSEDKTHYYIHAVKYTSM